MAHLYTHLGRIELFFALADWRCFAIPLTPATLLERPATLPELANHFKIINQKSELHN